MVFMYKMQRHGQDSDIGENDGISMVPLILTPHIHLISCGYFSGILPMTDPCDWHYLATNLNHKNQPFMDR